jgi:hypothetical protein
MQTNHTTNNFSSTITIEQPHCSPAVGRMREWIGWRRGTWSRDFMFGLEKAKTTFETVAEDFEVQYVNFSNEHNKN